MSEIDQTDNEVDGEHIFLCRTSCLVLQTPKILHVFQMSTLLTAEALWYILYTKHTHCFLELSCFFTFDSGHNMLWASF